MEKIRVYSDCPQHVAKRYEYCVRNVVSLDVWFRCYSICRRKCDISIGVVRRIKEQRNSVLPLGDAEADLIKDINYINIICKGPPAKTSIDVDVYKSRTDDLCYVRKLGLYNTDGYS